METTLEITACNQCKYKGCDTPLCYHPLCKEPDVIYGSLPLHCKVARKEDYCGQKARYFEKKVSLFRRIFGVG